MVGVPMAGGVAPARSALLAADDAAEADVIEAAAVAAGVLDEEGAPLRECFSASLSCFSFENSRLRRSPPPLG